MALLSWYSSCVSKRGCTLHVDFSTVLVCTRPMQCCLSHGAAERFLVSSGSMSWKGSDSACCSGFLEKAVVWSYTSLGCISGAFFSLRASFHVHPTHCNKCSWNIFKWVYVHMCSVGICPWSIYSSVCFKGGSSVWKIVVSQQVCELWIRKWKFCNKRNFHFLFSLCDRLSFSCDGRTVCATTGVEYLWKQSSLWQSGIILYCSLFIHSCVLKLSIKRLKGCMMWLPPSKVTSTF